jgi:hypothetical protein
MSLIFKGRCGIVLVAYGGQDAAQLPKQWLSSGKSLLYVYSARPFTSARYLPSLALERIVTIEVESPETSVLDVDSTFGTAGFVVWCTFGATVELLPDGAEGTFLCRKACMEITITIVKNTIPPTITMLSLKCFPINLKPLQ